MARGGLSPDPEKRARQIENLLLGARKAGATPAIEKLEGLLGEAKAAITGSQGKGTASSRAKKGRKPRSVQGNYGKGKHGGRGREGGAEEPERGDEEPGLGRVGRFLAGVYGLPRD